MLATRGSESSVTQEDRSSANVDRSPERASHRYLDEGRLDLVTLWVFVHDVSPLRDRPVREASGRTRVRGRLERGLSRTLRTLAASCPEGIHLALIADECRREPEAAKRLVEEATSSGTRVELVAHGLFHHRDHGQTLTIRPFSWATGYSDELSGLARGEACLRLRESRRILEDLFERPVVGFVPPAFQWGPVRPDDLFDAGYTYGLGLTSLVHAEGRVKVGTRSWDPGRLGACPLVGRALSAFGALTHLRGGTVPCVVVHPDDVGRGLDVHAHATLARYRRRGMRPSLVSHGLTKPEAKRDPRT